MTKTQAQMQTELTKALDAVILQFIESNPDVFFTTVNWSIHDTLNCVADTWEEAQ